MTEIGTLGPSFNGTDLERLKEEFEVSYEVDVEGHKTCRFIPKEEGARGILVSVKDGRLYLVELLPRFREGYTEQQLVNDLLQSLGGAKEYDWGAVRFCVNDRSGYSSVIVKYK